MNQIFPRLADALRRKGVSVETVRDFFEGMTKDSTRFPDDAELRARILDKRAYGRIPSRILSDLLWSLELAMRTGMTEETPRPPSLWVEHVMPSNWEENWPLNGTTVESGDFGVAGYIERETAIHTLGNLTIITDQLNRSLSNAAFEDKVPKLFEHSNLTLNRRIAEHDTWDEKAIRDRGEALAELAADVWPSPSSM